MSTSKGKNDLSSEEKRWILFKRNILISFIALVVVVLFLVGYSIFQKNESSNTHHSLNIQKICELTTLECRYHNVAATDNESGLFGMTSTKVWLEYDGIIELGIDVNQVVVEEPTSDGVVKIYLPPAKILANRKDESSIKKPVYDVAILGEFTGEDERMLANQAAKNMENDAQVNNAILSHAYDNAKSIIEQHVINAGLLVGKDYTVKWISKPEDTKQVSSEKASSVEK